MRDKIFFSTWIMILTAIVVAMTVPASREFYRQLSNLHPYLLGFAQMALLGMMGELLGSRFSSGRWTLRGIRIHQRLLSWGVLGMIFTVGFPLFSYGVDGLISASLLPSFDSSILSAFWKSFFFNMVFTFPLMVFQRIQGTLIEQGRLFSIWPLVEIYESIDWQVMFRKVGATIFWFWIPANTVSFILPAEFRVLSAALLSIVFGFVMGRSGRERDASQS